MRLNLFASAMLPLVVFAGCQAPVASVWPAVSPLAPAAPPRNADLSPTSALAPADGDALQQRLSNALGPGIVASRVEPTGSMRPFFDSNAILSLEAAPFSDLKVGDVVTFWHPKLQRIVVHRLAEKHGKTFWSRGDHNGAMDTVYVTDRNYLRRLVGIIYLQRPPDPRPPTPGASRSAQTTGAARSAS